MGARAKVYEWAFRIGGKVDRTFSGSMLNAQKNLGLLNKQVTSLESNRAGVKKFRDLKKQVGQTELALKNAQSETRSFADQLKTFEKQGINKSKEKLRDLHLEMARLTKKIKNAKNPSANLKKELAATRDKAADLKREIAATEKETKKISSGFERARKKSRSLKDKLLEQRTEIARLNRSMGQAGISTRNLAADNVALERRLNRTRAAQQKLNNVMLKQKANARARDQKRGQLFDAAAMGVTAAFPMVFAGRFEQAMAEVKAISGATERDFASLSEKALELGASTSFSASEAAGGMKYLAMAGFEANQVVAAMPGMLAMARAGGTDLAITSDVASNILSGFSLKAESMGNVADILTQTFTSSNTTLEMLGETMKYVGPVATKAGISLENAATMAGLLGSVGIQASESGTALRAMILRLAAPTGEAADTLSELGVETRDADGNIRPMVELLKELALETENLGSGEQLEIYKKIFGERPAASVAELIDKAGSDGITKYLKKIQDNQGVAIEKAKIMDDTMFGSLKRLASAGEGLAISFGGRLIPVLRPVIESVTWLTAKTIALTNRFPKTTTVVGTLAAGTTALGVTLIAGGYAFTIVKGGVLGLRAAYLVLNNACLLTRGQLIALTVQQKAAAAASGIMTAAQWALNVALNANPIGLIVAGVAALAGGALLVYNYWEPISGFFTGIWEKIKGLFSWIFKLRRFLPGFNDELAQGEKSMEALQKAATSGVTAKKSGGTITVQFSPTVNVPPGANAGEVRRAADASLDAAASNLKTDLETLMHQERRLAYE